MRNPYILGPMLLALATMSGCIALTDGSKELKPLLVSGMVRNCEGAPSSGQHVRLALGEPYADKRLVEHIHRQDFATETRFSGFGDTCFDEAETDPTGQFRHTFPARRGHVYGAVIMPIPFVLRNSGAGTGEIMLMLMFGDSDGAIYCVSGNNRRVQLRRVEIDPSNERGFSFVELPEDSHRAGIKKRRKQVELELEVTLPCPSEDRAEDPPPL